MTTLDAYRGAILARLQPERPASPAKPDDLLTTARQECTLQARICSAARLAYAEMQHNKQTPGRAQWEGYGCEANDMVRTCDAENSFGFSSSSDDENDRLKSTRCVAAIKVAPGVVATAAIALGPLTAASRRSSTAVSSYREQLSRSNNISSRDRQQQQPARPWREASMVLATARSRIRRSSAADCDDGTYYRHVAAVPSCECNGGTFSGGKDGDGSGAALCTTGCASWVQGAACLSACPKQRGGGLLGKGTLLHLIHNNADLGAVVTVAAGAVALMAAGEAAVGLDLRAQAAGGPRPVAAPSSQRRDLLRQSPVEVPPAYCWEYRRGAVSEGANAAAATANRSAECTADADEVDGDRDGESFTGGWAVTGRRGGICGSGGGSASSIQSGPTATASGTSTPTPTQQQQHHHHNHAWQVSGVPLHPTLHAAAVSRAAVAMPAACAGGPNTASSTRSTCNLLQPPPPSAPGPAAVTRRPRPAAATPRRGCSSNAAIGAGVLSPSPFIGRDMRRAVSVVARCDRAGLPSAHNPLTYQPDGRSTTESSRDDEDGGDVQPQQEPTMLPVQTHCPISHNTHGQSASAVTACSSSRGSGWCCDGAAGDEEVRSAPLPSVHAQQPPAHRPCDPSPHASVHGCAAGVTRQHRVRLALAPTPPDLCSSGAAGGAAGPAAAAGAYTGATADAPRSCSRRSLDESMLLASSGSSRNWRQQHMLLQMQPQGTSAAARALSSQGEGFWAPAATEERAAAVSVTDVPTAALVVVPSVLGACSARRDLASAALRSGSGSSSGSVHSMSTLSGSALRQSARGGLTGAVTQSRRVGSGLGVVGDGGSAGQVEKGEGVMSRLFKALVDLRSVEAEHLRVPGTGMN